MKGRDRAVREHRAAVAAFLQGVERTETGAWYRPVAPGKWTPAQITEHLVLAYEALLRELNGQAPMRMRVGPAMERILRWFLLPHILFHRSFPLRARSPRETRPEGVGLDPHDAASRIAELASLLEEQVGQTRLTYLTHPYFGRLPPVRVLRFCAAHLEHHLRQLPTAPPPPR